MGFSTRARGYQKGHTLGFYTSPRTTNIDYYVTGLSITYNNNPRQHIWTFANGATERRSNSGNCPCASRAGTSPPPFVANNYYCEAVPLSAHNYTAFFFDDTLWMEQDVQEALAVTTLPNLGSIIS